MEREPITSADSTHTKQLTNCVCGEAAPPAVTDPSHLISSHRTSQGHVVYYRCGCGRPRVALVRVAGRT